MTAQDSQPPSSGNDCGAEEPDVASILPAGSDHRHDSLDEAASVGAPFLPPASRRRHHGWVAAYHRTGDHAPHHGHGHEVDRTEQVSLQEIQGRRRARWVGCGRLVSTLPEGEVQHVTIPLAIRARIDQ